MILDGVAAQRPCRLVRSYLEASVACFTTEG